MIRGLQGRPGARRPSRTSPALPITPPRPDADPPQHHVQRLPRAGEHPTEPAARHREAIIGLADDPHPPGSSLLKGIGGCYYIAIDDYYILYHLDEEEGLTVLGVLHGPYHPLH